jgi:hypothetical protein
MVNVEDSRLSEYVQYNVNAAFAPEEMFMNLVSVQRDEYGEDIPGTKIQLLYADTLKELCAVIGKFFNCFV